MGAGGPPLTALILAQLLLGFVAPSIVAYHTEARMRRRFLQTSRRAAAVLGGRGAGRGRASMPPLPPATGKLHHG